MMGCRYGAYWYVKMLVHLVLLCCCCVVVGASIVGCLSVGVFVWWCSYIWWDDGLFACWCWYGVLLALIRWCVCMVRCWHGEVLYMVRCCYVGVCIGMEVFVCWDVGLGW